MRKFRLESFVVLLLVAVAGAQSKPTPESPEKLKSAANESYSRFPVKRAVLYKNGFGYFEHTARVRGKSGPDN